MRFDAPLLWDFSERLATHLKASLPTVAVFVGQPATLPATGYVVADLAAADEWVDRAAGVTSAGSMPVTLRCCGVSQQQAINTMDLVAGAMRDWQPFPEQHVSRMRLTNAGPIVLDDSIKTDRRWSISLTYRFDS